MSMEGLQLSIPIKLAGPSNRQSYTASQHTLFEILSLYSFKYIKWLQKILTFEILEFLMLAMLA